jgi:hypothetical protein
MADRQTPTPRGSGDSGERRPPSRSGGYNERPQSPRSSSGYGERPQAPRGGSSYGERPQAPRGGSGYGERPQPSRGGSGYGERPQPSRGGSGYGERPQPPRSSSGGGERRPAPSRSSSGSRQSAPRRVDVIRCENCGEDYSITYKRCPFCDERPGRGSFSGKRVANTRGGGYGRPVNPIQIAGLVVSLALIVAALFIVFRFVGAPLFGGKKPPVSSQGSSQSTGQTSSQPGGSSNPVTPPEVQSITLNNADVPLEHGGTYQFTANLLPAGATGQVTWSVSDSTVATVDATGLVTNINAGASDVKITVTAACGDLSAQTSVTCKARAGGGNNGPVTSGTSGRIVNAEKGLNIRSGPGTNYEKVASAQNNARVTILGEENGWYKIKYNNDKVGYVSKDYISVG